MPEATVLRCFLCGHKGADIAQAVTPGSFVGEFHLTPRCVDIEACWRRVDDQGRAPAHDMTFQMLRDAIEEIRPKP